MHESRDCGYHRSLVSGGATTGVLATRWPRLIGWLVVLACSAIAAPTAAAAAPATNAKGLPDTWDGVHLAQTFNYLTNPATELGHIDLVWSSSVATQPPGVANLFPLAFERSPDFGANAHPLSWFQANHPDWVEYQCDQNTPAYEFGAPGIPLDIANPAVRDYQWNTLVLPALQQGYAGVAFDNLHLRNAFLRCGHKLSNGTGWVPQYAGTQTNPPYANDVRQWTADMAQRIHSYSAHAIIGINYSFDGNQSLDANLSLTSLVDLVFDEGGFTNFGVAGDNYPSTVEWNNIRSLVAASQAKGVCYVENGEEPEPSGSIPPDQRAWVVANYLLTKDRCTYTYISGRTPSQEYGRLLLYPEYKAKIGHPVADMRVDGNVASRLYSCGFVAVNPTTGGETAHLPPGSYSDTQGRTLSDSARLGPDTGSILVRHSCSPLVRVRCPRSAGAGGCRVKLRVVTKRRHGKAKTRLARAKIKRGKTGRIAVEPKPAFAVQLAWAKKVLVRETIRTHRGSQVRIRRVKLAH
jgi:hypothetical protein